MEQRTNNDATGKVTVFYDGACPSCVHDRKQYEKLAGQHSEQVCWFDITDKEQQLRELGIDPNKAVTELHIRDSDGQVLSELDAYIVLMKKVPLLKPLAWLISLPLIRPLLARWYHWSVRKRLMREGRLPD